MSAYVPKPDDEHVNSPRASPLKDAIILVAGFFAVVGIFIFVLSFTGEWLAKKISPEMETQLFGRLQTFGDEKDRALSKVDAAFAPIVKRLLGETKVPIQIVIICDENPNAFALPGGTIAFTSHLIDHLKSENGLAFVLGHELGHFENRDHLAAIGRSLGVLVAASFIGLAGSEMMGLQITEQIIGNTFNRRQESLADEHALELLQKGYGHLSGAEEFFNYILSSKDSWLGKIPSFLSTHPNPKERLAVLAEKQKLAVGELIPLSKEIKKSTAFCLSSKK